MGAILAEVILCCAPSSEHNFGELGAILTEVMVGVARPSEHNLGELGANLAEVMVGVAHFWDRLGVTLGGLRGDP